eukprot:TRINITY_DN20090_c0_g1_i1.p1 TRINITY_DN20090_c0_g1~~TRINITY_DN20090_c0_g1_i1.p1  ORF type:complete len:354 (+),score=88.73 TRINITY_DN20090_c0_g1_i1:85-1146(+)
MAAFPFDVRRALGADGRSAIVALTAKDVPLRAGRSTDPQRLSQLTQVIDTMGSRSARAQGLARPITSAALLSCSEHTLYVAAAGRTVAGILKVGTKRLFIRTGGGQLAELEPLCVLDFYVHESCQRAGVGKAIFDHMLCKHGVAPQRLAFDRPSPKLLGFLRKHCGLVDHIPQSNNFVVYNRYFDPPGHGPPPVPELTCDELAAMIRGEEAPSAARPSAAAAGGAAEQMRLAAPQGAQGNHLVPLGGRSAAQRQSRHPEVAAAAPPPGASQRRAAPSQQWRSPPPAEQPADSTPQQQPRWAAASQPRPPAPYTGYDIITLQDKSAVSSCTASYGAGRRRPLRPANSALSRTGY